MPFLIHTTFGSIPTNIPVAYYKKGYLVSQDHPSFRAYSGESMFIAFNIDNKNAISIPRSPFGSFFVEKNNENNLKEFWDFILNDLRQEGVKRVEIRNPASIYNSFPSQIDFEALGFQLLYQDLNQHIDLSSETEIHQMQERKLKALKNEGFHFRKMNEDEFETAHKFLTVCRQAQGLQINISLEQLNTLAQNLPNTYDCFGVFREEKISALCFTVNVSEDIVYYYLPGTSPMFRNQSPMVMLLTGMIDYFKGKGYSYLDLGVSSFEGKVQETLKVFKERMGGVNSDKITYGIDL